MPECLPLSGGRGGLRCCLLSRLRKYPLSLGSFPAGEGRLIVGWWLSVCVCVFLCLCKVGGWRFGVVALCFWRGGWSCFLSLHYFCKKAKGNQSDMYCSLERMVSRFSLIYFMHRV